MAEEAIAYAEGSIFCPCQVKTSIECILGNLEIFG